MSTAIEPSSPYANCDEYIEHRIKVARNRIKFTDLLTASLLASVLLIGYVLTFTIFDHWIISGGFRPVTRATMLSLALAACAYIVYRYVIRPWTKEVSSLYAAKMLDDASGGMDGSLLSLIDLNASGSSASESIRKTIEKRAAVGLAKVNMDEAIDRHWLMQLGFLLFGLVLTTCLYAVFSPKAINLLRPLSLSSTAVATQTRILKVQPGHATIQAGAEMEVIVDIGGNVPDEVLVMYSTADKTYVDEKLTMQASEGEGRFRVLLAGSADRGLRQNFTYRVTAGDAESEQFSVTVDQPPSANVTQITYRYPDYMALPIASTQNGNIDVWEGSDIILSAESNVPLRSASVAFSDDTTFAVPAEEFVMDVSGTKLTGRFQLNLREDGTSAKYYRIEVSDENDRTDPQPTVYGVTVRPDKSPIVKLLDPIRDLVVPSNAIVPLLVEAEDPDFLLRSVKLNYEVNGELRTPEPLFDATRQSLQKSWTGTWEFALEPLKLKQGDVVRYYITARDNKPPLGSQSRSGTLQFEIQAPTTAEEAQKQLQRDKELQEQQQRDRNSERQNDETVNPDESNPQPAEADNQPSPNDTNPEEKSDSHAADKQSAGDENGNQTAPNGQQPGDKSSPGPEAAATESDKSEGGTKPSDKDAGKTGENSPPQSGNEADKGQPSSNGNKPSDKSRPSASDSDAMQRLLESYKETETRQNNGESPEDASPDQKQRNGEPSLKPDGARLNQTRENESNANDSATEAKPPKNGTTPESDTSEEMTKSSTDESPSTDGGQPNADAATDKVDKTAGDERTNDQESKQTDVPPTNEMPQDNQKQSETGSNGKEPDSKPQPDPSKMNEGESSSTEKPNESPDNNSEQQGQDAGKQENKAGQQRQDAGKQENKAGQQGQDAGKQEDKAGQQRQDAGKQEDKAGQQRQDAGKQEDKAGQQGQDAGKQEDKAGQQGQDAGKQENKAGQQGQDAGKQENKSGQQGQDAGKQEDKSGQQRQDAGKQENKAGQQGQDAGKQENKAGQQGQDAGKQEDKSGQQGQDAGKQENKAGQQGQDAGKQEDKSGQQGQDAGKQEDKAGQQGQEGGMQGAEEGGELGGEGASGAKAEQSQQGNGGRGGKNPAGGGGSNTSGKDQPQGNAEQGPAGSSGAGEEASNPFKTDDPNVQDAAKAANLVLKRLQKDLERGKVDQKLLDELGWTEDQLEAFSERMQKQLETLKDEAAADSKSQQLQRRRVEELLKSLDLEASPQERVGRTNRDIEKQDTTSQRSRPPAQYKDLLELYQRSLSEGRRR